MQKTRALQTYIDERRLHPRDDANHFAKIDIASDAVSGRARYVHFVNRTILDEGNAGLEIGHLNEQLFSHYAFHPKLETQPD